jgi:hypothetical protein
MVVVPVVPGATDPLVTSPVEGPDDIIVATAELLVLHTPPVIASLTVIVTPPEHIRWEPEITPANGVTVTLVVAIPQGVP